MTEFSITRTGPKISKHEYEFEVNADAEFIDALNDSLSAIRADEESEWSFTHVKLNAQKLFLSTRDETGQCLKNILEVSVNHPRFVVVLNMNVRAADLSPVEGDKPSGVSALIVEGWVVSEKYISSEENCYRFGNHKHSFTKEGGYRVPGESCVESHYGYLFHFSESAGRQFVFSRKFTPGEDWSHYKGLGQLLAYAPGFDLSRLSAKAFMCFADSEAELMLMETRERAQMGTFSLHPVCHELNADVLSLIFATEEEYEKS